MKPTTNRQELFSNENRLQIGSLIFSLLLIIGGLFWLKSQMELAHTVTNRGYTKDAILNPYLAANKFLNTQGITTENAIDINVIINALSPNDSIFLLNKRPLRPRQIEKIMPWLSNGGHLIMTPATLWNPNVNSADDDFLNFFGIQYFDQRVQYDFNTSRGDWGYRRDCNSQFCSPAQYTKREISGGADH